MTMRWLHEWPTVGAGLLVVGVFVALSLAGLWLTRPWARRRCGDSNELANYYIAAVGVFYALLVGLIAVATWENHSRVEDVVTGEAVAVSDLYRDMEAYPSPLREELRVVLRQYVQAVIEKDWPQQLQGEAPTKDVGHVNQLVHRAAGGRRRGPAENLSGCDVDNESVGFRAVGPRDGPRGASARGRHPR
jgi:hypothetical protein